MKRINGVAVAAALLLVAQSAFAQMDETVRKVENGGLHAKGWLGVVDANAAKAGQTVNDASLTAHGKDLHIVTGPAITYWNTDKAVKGNYSVKAEFNEAQYMNLNDHPHPYGIMIGGNDLGTDKQSYLYCAAYGNGSFIVRGMGPAPFQMGGRRPIVSEAVHKAAGKGSPVTQKIEVSVKDDKVECSINGTVVATYPKSELVADGKLKSLDGFVGIRAAHNTEVVVHEFKVDK
ncbi:MAG TPA: hypothetical protein VM100_00705 [Longimicrobiales bacterium]|nr:hypothetical protein [Longimicrobiales bacterium]